MHHFVLLLLFEPNVCIPLCRRQSKVRKHHPAAGTKIKVEGECVVDLGAVAEADRAPVAAVIAAHPAVLVVVATIILAAAACTADVATGRALAVTVVAGDHENAIAMIGMATVVTVMKRVMIAPLGR